MSEQARAQTLLTIRTVPIAGGSAHKLTCDDGSSTSNDISEDEGQKKTAKVKHAIAKHTSSSKEPAAGSHLARPDASTLTRVVRTHKPDSVFGSGLVVNEEPAAKHTNDGNVPTPSVAGDFLGLRQYISKKSEQCEAIESHDVLLYESTPEPSNSEAGNPLVLGFNAQPVPPELALYKVDAKTWERFITALNAAILVGKIKADDQISRWNSDVFEECGFCISLKSLEPTPRLAFYTSA